MHALATMDVANNNLSGAVPRGWGSPESVFVTEGVGCRYSFEATCACGNVKSAGFLAIIIVIIINIITRISCQQARCVLKTSCS